MSEVYLVNLCGYWYFFAQQAVQQILAPPCTEIRKGGQLWLQVPGAEAAELCPLHLLFSWPQPAGAIDDHFVVLSHGGRRFALPMHGEGRACSLREQALRLLPAAFGEFSRQMVPRLLVNGCEVIMQINMDELIRAMDKIVYLRRKKLRQQSRLQSGMQS